MNLDRDLISIVMACFNTEKYIDKAISSILNQSYPNLEIIVVEDCSTDKSLEILESYEDKITLIKNTENLNFSRSRNKGIMASKGKWIRLFDSDDIMIEDSTQNIINQVSKIPENNMKLFTADFVTINNLGETTGLLQQGHFNHCTLEQQKQELLKKMYGTLPAGIMSREIFDKIGGFRESMATTSDYEFLLHANSLGYLIYHLSLVTLKYRIHSQSMTAGGFDRLQNMLLRNEYG